MSSWFTNTLIATISNLVYVRLLRLQSSYYCKLKANIIFFEAKRKRLTQYKYINIFNATKTLLAIIPGVYLKYNRRREKRTQFITFDRKVGILISSFTNRVGIFTVYKYKTQIL